MEDCLTVLDCKLLMYVCLSVQWYLFILILMGPSDLVFTYSETSLIHTSVIQLGHDTLATSKEVVSQEGATTHMYICTYLCR